MNHDFVEFDKIARLSRQCVVTEKIDGTNAQIFISEDPLSGDVTFLTGSRTKWITPDDDNFGFARWAQENKEELLKLGPGSHFGEWWGQGIQRKYDLSEKRFSLFNTHRWSDDTVRPACCHVVPILAQGIFTTKLVDDVLATMVACGSFAAPGFMKPEGVIIYHTAARLYLKKTLEKDTEWKGKQS